MARALAPFLVLLVLVGGAAVWLALSRSKDSPRDVLEPLAERDVLRRYPGARLPPEGVAFGQEIWLSYRLDRGEELPGWRTGRTREETLELARTLYGQVRAGADLGALARTHSNAPGGRARGYVALPREGQPLDSRERVLLNTHPGQLTPLVEWNKGFWFARRVTVVQGQELHRLFQQELRRRAKARAVVLGHQDARPHRADFDEIPRGWALAKAHEFLMRVQKGESFAELAPTYSNDASKNRGGLLHATNPREGEDPAWLHWGDVGYPDDMMTVILYTGQVGRVHPQVLDTARGAVVLEILEREGDT
ncbi:MAG: peptidylprolyl isomerase [Planctomycetota bacterium]